MTLPNPALFPIFLKFSFPCCLLDLEVKSSLLATHATRLQHAPNVEARDETGAPDGNHLCRDAQGLPGRGGRLRPVRQRRSPGEHGARKLRQGVCVDEKVLPAGTCQDPPQAEVDRAVRGCRRTGVARVVERRRVDGWYGTRRRAAGHITEQ